MSFWTSLESIYKADIEPFLSGIVHSEVAALAPIATQAVSSLATEEVAALASGGKTTGNVLANVVKSTAAAAEAAGINAASSSILAAVGTAINKK